MTERVYAPHEKICADYTRDLSLMSVSQGDGYRSLNYLDLLKVAELAYEAGRTSTGYEYGFTGSRLDGPTPPYVHDPSPTRESVERLWGPEGRNELHLGTVVRRTKAGSWEAAPDLDPKPWRYDLFGHIPVEKRAREAEQVTGGFTFAPQEGYSQEREDYR